MIHPPVVECDMRCGNSYPMDEDEYAKGDVWLFRMGWDRKIFRETTYDICPPKGCMTLFMKQCKSQKPFAPENER